MAAAAARLGVSVQTVSAQVRALERSLGRTLLKPAGRGLALTDAGAAAMRHADQIFELGAALSDVIQDAAEAPSTRLSVGVSEGLAKLIVHHYLRPVLTAPRLRLRVHEAAFDDLLADLALHRLDVVLADRPAPGHASLKLYSHAIGTSTLAWYGTAVWRERARRRFPASLAEVPLLLPSVHDAVRPRLDLWLERHGVRPRIAGEFADSALLKTFAAAGMGVFAADELVERDLAARYRVRRVGPCEGVTDTCYAITSARKVQHPLVQRLLR